MVRVQVPLTSVEAGAQLGQHLALGRLVKAKPSAVNYDRRLPAAVHAPPSVAPEAYNPQPAVVGIIPAFVRAVAAVVELPLPGDAVNLAAAALGKFGTVWHGAGMKDRFAHDAANKFSNEIEKTV